MIPNMAVAIVLMLFFILISPQDIKGCAAKSSHKLHRAGEKAHWPVRGISYGDDPDKIQSVVLETIKKVEGVNDAGNTIFDYAGFVDSSINFNIRFWIGYPRQRGYFSRILLQYAELLFTTLTI